MTVHVGLAVHHTYRQSHLIHTGSLIVGTTIILHNLHCSISYTITASEKFLEDDTSIEIVVYKIYKGLRYQSKRNPLDIEAHRHVHSEGR